MKIQSNNPTKVASELQKFIGWDSPDDFTLEEIANSIGLIVKFVPIEGSEGRIIMNESNGIISINSKIKYQEKINFIIAHEIGHFLLHKGISPLFSDSYKSLSDWYRKGSHEQQANEFASELLMPELLFRHLIDNKKMEMKLIDELSSYFHVSRMAICFKYVTHGNFPSMIIYIENGIVKWKRGSQDFPFPFLKNDSKVPALTVAGDCFYKNQLEENPEEIYAIEWFPEDFNANKQPDFKLMEQCYKISDNAIVSFLWTN